MNTSLQLPAHSPQTSPHLRAFALLVLAAGLVLFVWMMSVTSSEIRFLLIFGFLGVSYWAWSGFSKERWIVQRCASAIGTVKTYSKTASSDGGYLYEVTYEF